MPDLIRKSCADFAADLASDAPTPGGGGAAALCGVLAASLTALITAGMILIRHLGGIQ